MNAHGQAMSKGVNQVRSFSSEANSVWPNDAAYGDTDLGQHWSR